VPFAVGWMLEELKGR